MLLFFAQCIFEKGQEMHICTVIKEKFQSLETERNKYIFKRDIDDDSDGAHLTSFGMQFQTEEG